MLKRGEIDLSALQALGFVVHQGGDESPGSLVQVNHQRQAAELRRTVLQLVCERSCVRPFRWCVDVSEGGLRPAHKPMQRPLQSVPGLAVFLGSYFTGHPPYAWGVSASSTPLWGGVSAAADVPLELLDKVGVQLVQYL
jgi:hypothetical protein